MAVRCAGGQVPECPVIDALFDDALKRKGAAADEMGHA